MSFDPTLALHHAKNAGYSWTGAIFHREKVSSTQDLARKAASEGAPEGTVFVADEQTHGRGRQGRAWIAPHGSALLASVLLRPAIPALHLPPLSLVIGLAIYDALLSEIPGDSLRIKWPNDLLIKGRKVAGILIEASLRSDRPESVIAGFGINLSEAALPPEIEPHTTCLQRHGASPSREKLLGQILAAIETKVSHYVQEGLGPLLPSLRAADGTSGRRVRWQDQNATVLGIAEDGRLLLATPQGSVAASFGEVLFTENLLK